MVPVGSAVVIATEIEELRNRLDRSLYELDRRRRELMDVRLQAERHPRVVVSVGLAAGLLAGGIGFAIARAGKRKSPPPISRVRSALRVALGEELPPREPETPPEPPALEKIFVAVGTTVLTAIASRLIQRAFAAQAARAVQGR